MSFFGINGWELLVLIVLAVVILGPERLPEYAAKLAQGVRRLRVMAEGAKVTLKDQLGPEYQDINWRQYDPRQYDPRRIVREALAEPLDYVAEPFRELAGEARGIRDEVVGLGSDTKEAIESTETPHTPTTPQTPGASQTATAEEPVGLTTTPTYVSRARKPTGTYWDTEAT